LFNTMAWLRDHGGAEIRGRPELLLSTTCCAAAGFEALPGAMVSNDGSTWFHESFPNPFGTYYVKVRARVGDGHGAGIYESPIHQFHGGEPPPATADLTMEKRVAPIQAPVGATVTFELTVANTGPDAATAVKVHDLLPAGYDYVSHVAGQGTY